jgi:ribosomal protein S18 acetylase RimI-like enzyme
MPDLEIIAFNPQDQSHIDTVKILFRQYYSYFDSLGIKLKLAEDGEERWMAATLQSVNRMSVLPLALAGGQIVGFAQGTLKLMPDYLGAHKAGVVQHVYVQEAHQRKGIAEALVSALEQWFREKQVQSVELQVITHNDKALQFWQKMGYEPELRQLRKSW